MKSTPRQARHYLLAAALLIAFPSIVSLYHGHTGKFLVAMASVNGSTFEHTVIYISEHGFWGAQGFIVNKPVPKDYKFSFPELSWNITLYNGGPVEFEGSRFLFLDDTTAENNFRIVDVGALRQQRPDIIMRMENHANMEPFRLFTGYSGWLMLQLNYEIMRGHWGVIDYDPQIMFETPPEKMWDRAAEKLLQERPAATGGA